jgi:hypothetical protein
VTVETVPRELTSGSDVTRRRTEPESSHRLTQSCSRVHVQDEAESLEESATKVGESGVLRPELSLQCTPRDQAWPAQVAHPIGEPDVDIQSQWRAFEDLERAPIDGDGRLRDLVEELMTEERSRNLVFRAARQWRLRLPRTCLYRAVCARETVDSLRIQPRGLEFETASSIGGRLRKMPDRRAPGPWA